MNPADTGQTRGDDRIRAIAPKHPALKGACCKQAIEINPDDASRPPIPRPQRIPVACGRYAPSVGQAQ